MIVKTELTKEEIGQVLMYCGALKDISEMTARYKIAGADVSAQINLIQTKIVKILIIEIES